MLSAEEPEVIDDPEAGADEAGNTQQVSEAVDSPVASSDVSQESAPDEDQNTDEDDSKESDE